MCSTGDRWFWAWLCSAHSFSGLQCREYEQSPRTAWLSSCIASCMHAGLFSKPWIACCPGPVLAFCSVWDRRKGWTVENVHLMNRVSKMEWLPKFGRTYSIGMDFAGIIEVARNFGSTFIQVQKSSINCLYWFLGSLYVSFFVYHLYVWFFFSEKARPE